MAESSESTPFLADTDRPDDSHAIDDAEAEVPTKTVPTNANLKRLAKILTICVSIASVLAVIFLTASLIIVNVAPFTSGYIYGAQYTLQELGICVFVSFILSTLMIFIQFPIIIALGINLTFTILAFIYAGNIFARAWPNENWCYYYRYPNQPYYPNPQCYEMRKVARILIGIGGGLGFLVGLIYLVLILLQIVVISRMKLLRWKGLFPSYPSGQYTFQITLGFIKKSPQNPDEENGNARADVVDGRLIDT